MDFDPRWDDDPRDRDDRDRELSRGSRGGLSNPRGRERLEPRDVFTRDLDLPRGPDRQRVWARDSDVRLRGSAVAVGLAAVVLLEELLIPAFQLGVEHHAMDNRTILTQPLGLALIRLVDLRVVKQLTWALKAGVEVLLALVPVAFEDVAATLGEDDERTAVADGNRSHELLFTQVPEFAAAWVVSLAAAVPEVVGVHDAERAGRRQRPRFGAAQENAVLTEPHALAVRTTWEIEITSEHITRVARVAFERIGRDASTALVQLTS